MITLKHLRTSVGRTQSIFPLLCAQTEDSRTPPVVTLACAYATRAIDYYNVLEVTPKATAAQIKASYYRLSKTFHPDVNKSKSAKARFADISEAYETLGNKAKRQQYDRRFGVGSTFTGTGGRNSGVDVEYQEFMKHGQFRKRGEAPTGRTNIYDFDEFYRVHYGDAIKNHQDKEAAKVAFEQELVDRKQNHKKRMITFTIFLLTIGLLSQGLMI